MPHNAAREPSRRLGCLFTSALLCAYALLVVYVLLYVIEEAGGPAFYQVELAGVLLTWTLIV